MSMNVIIAEAWTSTERRYLVTPGASGVDTYIVFDKLEERVAFRSVSEKYATGSRPHTQCVHFVEVACSQAVVVALREAGYLPV